MRRLAVTVSFPLLLFAARFIPFDRLPVSCGFLRITGLPCPTCGMTRSVVATAHLDFPRAFAVNALGPALLGTAALIWGLGVYQEITGRRTAVWDWAGRRALLLTLAGIGILLIFGAVRIWVIVH